MKKISSIIVGILLFSISVNAQSGTYDACEDQWKIVEQFELKSLPKSALTEVEKIYKKAKRTKNHPQLIKTLLYKSKFALTLEENAQLKVIKELKKEISSTSFPTKNILESILADLYWQYFQQNRWRFYNRTNTAQKVDSTDFRTWDLQTIFEETHFHYQQSLENALTLQQTDLKLYSNILNSQKNSKIFRPTLYDFLTHRAIGFYKTNERNLNRPTYKFEIDNANILGDNETFTKQLLETPDSLSQQLHALKIYKNLTLFHLKDSFPDALVDLTLSRLDFVKDNTILKNKEVLYQSTLEGLFKKYKSLEVSSEIAYKLALALHQQASDYLPKEREDNRWKSKKALEICEEAIAKFPTSSGAQKCKSLQQQILNKSLQITNEKFVPIGKSSRLLVSYKNMNQLYFKALLIDQTQIKKLNTIYNDSEKIAFINKLKSAKNWESKLRNENDYQNHKTEVIIPELEQGSYLILASTSKNLSENETFAYKYSQVSDLALLEDNDSGIYTYHVVNRNNGKPIPNATVIIENNKTRYAKSYKKTAKTNKKGKVSFTVNGNYNNVTITVLKNNDEATFGNYYLYKPYVSSYNEEDEELIVKPFLFTDRSIYRPGQTVFFKGILIQKKGNNSKVVTNEVVTITLYDANDQEVKELEIKTNEFGSFSGEFILPSNGLTGEYHIEIDEGFDGSDFYDTIDDFDYDNEFRFSVEEYKRPKFETEFKPITETYKLNDSVVVKGFAKAFAGSSITDAKVKFRVRRTAQFPAWCWYYRPYFSSESQEITHGETSTDKDGNFEIVFKALPDLSVDKTLQPTFNYEVVADVTDINGETRSTETIVKVGYHALNVSIAIANKLDKTKKHTIEITTNNLNGEFVPTKGILKIYKLKAPNNPIRNRPWPAPDYQDIAKVQFKKLFPHEAYENEDNPKNWKRGELVFETKINTSTSKEVNLKNSRKWTSGKYLVEFVCQDKFDQEVRDEKKIDLFDSKEKTVSDNKLFSMNTDKLIYDVDDKVLLNVSSASKNFNVYIEIEKDYKIVKSYNLSLNNETKTIEIPVKKNDIGGFGIKYHYVCYNSFKSGAQFISVPYPKNELKIDVSTFRDKLQPGQKETWSFKLEGSKGDKVAAEILASMYDASLDQFVSHNWNFNPVQPSDYRFYGNRINARNSFIIDNFRVKLKGNSYIPFSNQYYDSLDWFGFSLNNNRWINSHYLKRLKNKQITLKGQRPNFDKTVSGIVTDDTGPLPGVSVIIKGTTYGTQTDFDGNYSIKVKDGDELVFSFVGMSSMSRKTKGINSLNIVLEADNQLDEVVVTAQGISTEKRSLSYSVAKVESAEMDDSIAQVLSGKASGVQIVNASGANGAGTEVKIRGLASLKNNKNVLYIVDGVLVNEFDINGINILNISVLKGTAATAIYGSKGANGVILITTKSGQKKQDDELSKIQARKNLQETAFFYPHLTTDADGNVSFNFTVPESLTRWKLQLLAHTKDLASTTKQLTTVTQKELMVIPNPPRFLREGDQITFASKIANLTDKDVTGISELQLFDALTDKPIDTKLGNADNQKNFTIDAKGNANVNWTLQIPDDVQAVKYRIVAKAGDFTDGEENALPVLSNRMLVTETMPMWLRSNQTKTFTLDKLKNNSSTTLKNHKLTLEVTSNPAWYAVQALPYLMEYPYECAEQTFSRYYANALASHIANSNPRIQEVFNQWASTDALLSNLEKNQELKSLIIQETPWLRDAQSETEQKKRIALLFDLNKMQNELQSTSRKLSQMQMSNGGFPWFKGSRYPNRYITQHIASGFGHLNKLGVASKGIEKSMLKRAVKFLDDEILEDYRKLEREAKRIRESAKTKAAGRKKEAAFWKQNHTGHFQIQYLYMRSFYKELAIDDTTQTALMYYTNQAYKFWTQNNLYTKGMIALIANRNSNALASKIIASLKENAINSDELGMYWKSNTVSWYWYQAPIETQALLIEAFSEIDGDIKVIDALKVWLLKNKQTNRWKTTKATTEAVYALLLQGTDWLEVTDFVGITIGDTVVDPLQLEDSKVEAGTGYFKTSWTGNEITQKMADVKLSKKTEGIAWGALYWQYFEDLDKITSAETPLKLQKKLFLKRNTDKGEELSEIPATSNLKLGDLVRVRIELKVDRAMEFVHMKDMRAAGFEPINVLSRYKWQDGLGYYESTKDAATNFFFDYLPKGVYVFEYDLRVNNKGNFSNGITTIQSMYAPEFSSHSEGVRVKVE